MTLHNRCYKIYVSEGSNDVVGVNRYLKKHFPEMGSRLRAMEELAETGLWEVKWHESSMDSSGRDFGVVMAYLG